MIHCRQVTICFTVAVYVTLLAASSCIVPRKYQANKPFVFKTDITVQGNIKNAERQDLQSRLANQLDDSLKVRTVSFAGIRKTLIRPAAFDTTYAGRSVLFMNALLNSLGYYEARITWDTTLKRVGRQQRVLVHFTVNTGKNLRLDSIGYALSDSSLQHLALDNRQASLLEKDKPYSQQLVSGELDRLIDVYRNNGYYKITKEDLYAEVDTVLAGLINPGLDPFEQVRLLNELQRRREHPTINVIIRQRTKQGAASLRKYTIGRVSIYPDLQLFEDSARAGYDSLEVNGIAVLAKQNKFKPSFLVKNTSLKPGAQYRQSDYYRTVNTFSQLGAWQQVNIALRPNDSLGIIDVAIELYPAKKQNMVIDLEATRNAGDVITTSNLFGIGVNLGFSNKNLARESIQSTTNIRGGIELGTKTSLIQTLQGSITQNVYFPRFILPFKFKNEEKFAAPKTILNFSTSYTDRRDFFTLGSVNGSIGYEWAKRRKVKQGGRESGALWFYSPFNIELLRPGIRDSLSKLFLQVPNLENSFRNGLIISQNLVYRSFVTKKNKNNTTYSALRMALEESGGVFGNIKYLDERANLYRYVKAEADYRHQIRFNKTAWAFRLYGGVGLPYGKLDTSGKTETSLPYIKSFFAGGPNSMRGWQVRRLGVGSNKYLDTLNNGQNGFDRFADIQLEGNAEFRFDVATFGSVKVKSAIFTDVGNIWRRTADKTKKEEVNGEFNINRLYTDIAVDAGTSLRFDFNYFLVRFDWAYKVKNPAFSEINYGWLHDITLASGQFQLGINYPF